VSASPEAVRNRNLRTLAALAGLFLLPLVFAFLTYYGTDWRPARHVNHGTLIQPARPLPALALPKALPGEAATPFHGAWSLVYVGSGECNADCRAALYLMRQTRVALNSDMTRVTRVFLVTSACCVSEFLAREHPGLTVLDASAESAAGLVQQFPEDARAHTVFIVDPLGNLMMSYDARQNPHGLLEDLKKLLRLSQIG
jgi:hypothetical protein